MTIKLIAIYDQPADPQAFDHHYTDIHTPIAKQIPGLMHITTSRVEKHLMGGTNPYLIAELVFEDQAAFDAAMASAENRAAGKDLGNFAKGAVSLMIAKSA